MRQKTIDKAIRDIERSIEYYQKRLNDRLEEEEKGNIADYKYKCLLEKSIKNTEIILADLAAIKRAIENNKKSVKISGRYTYSKIDGESIRATSLDGGTRYQEIRINKLIKRL